MTTKSIKFLLSNILSLIILINKLFVLDKHSHDPMVTSPLSDIKKSPFLMKKYFSWFKFPIGGFNP